MVAGVVLLGIGFVLITMPEHYEAGVRIIIAPPPSASGADPERDNDAALTSMYSSAVLFPVITNLNLHQKWSKSGRAVALTVEETCRRLANNVSIQSVRGTRLCEIRVKDSDPQQAAAIANEIAHVYRHVMRSQWLDRTDASIKALEAEFRQADSRAKDAQALVERLGKELNLPTNAVELIRPVTFHGEDQDKSDGTDYWKARGALEVLSKRRDELFMRLIQETVDSPPRRSSMVEIIDPAEPPTRPSSRNKVLATVAFVAGAASLGLGAVCTFSARTHPCT